MQTSIYIYYVYKFMKFGISWIRLQNKSCIIFKVTLTENYNLERLLDFSLISKKKLIEL